MYIRVILGVYLLWGPCFVVVGGSGRGLWGSHARSKYPTCNRFLFHERVMLILSLLVQTKTYYAVYAYHMNLGKPGVSEFCTFLPLGNVSGNVWITCACNRCLQICHCCSCLDRAFHTWVPARGRQGVRLHFRTTLFPKGSM